MRQKLWENYMAGVYEELKNDPIMESLLSGSLRARVIEDVKNGVNEEPFRPVTTGEMGRDDIFIK